MVIPSNPNDLLVKFNSDFQQFVFSNDILVVASAYSIGLATHELIIHIFSLLLPLKLYIISKFMLFDNLYLGFVKFPFLYGLVTGFFSLLFHFFKWLITIALTFFLVEYLLNNKIVGLKSTVKEEQEKDFIVSKISAKKDNDTPIQKKVAEIKIKEKKDEIVGEKIVDDKQKTIINEVFSSQEIEPFETGSLLNMSTI
jgi:hypothetical protein